MTEAGTTQHEPPAGAPPRERTQRLLTSLAWAAAVAIPMCMFLIDRPVALWAAGIKTSAAVAVLREVADPLGRWPACVLALVLCLVLAALVRTRFWLSIAGLVVAVVAVGSGVAHILKTVSARPRPFATIEWGYSWADSFGNPDMMLEGACHSFPSGDVTIAAGLAALAILVFSAWRGRYWLLLIPAVSCASRIAGGWHYPADCLGGFALGTAGALLVWRGWRARLERKASATTCAR